jgi:Tol biopolymer transport system component
VNGDGSRRKQLTHDQVTEWNPAWSPDHRSIAYVRGAPQRIWVMSPDGSRQRPLHLFARRTERLTQPAWSPDGRRLAASVWTGHDFQLYVYDIRTGRRTPLGSVGQEQTPEWSPDGTSIAYTGVRGRSGQQIFISSVRGRRWRQLTHCVPGECVSPSWSPNGRRIAFACSGALCVVDADGSSLRRLGKGGSPAWSPDGRWIAFAGPYGDIFVVRPGGKGLRRVAKRSPDQTRVNLDPDW